MSWQHSYSQLHYLFGRDYAGYKPSVREIPNGDGKVDVDKRYLHIAPKYNPPAWALRIYAKAYMEALTVHERLGLAPALMPDWRQCALRVLEYPKNVGGELHTDFDLFTINLWRNPYLDTGARKVAGLDVHNGELMELFGRGRAQPHQIPPQPVRQQSLVFFALPSLETELPWTERTVGEWLKERYARSRA